MERPSAHYQTTVALVAALYAIVQTAGGRRTAFFFGEKSEYTLLLQQMMGAALHLDSPTASDAEKEHGRKCLHCLAMLTCLLPDGAQMVQVARPPDLTASGMPAEQAASAPAYCVMLDAEARRLVSLPKAGPIQWDDLCNELLDDANRSNVGTPVLPTQEMIYTLWTHWRTCGQCAHPGAPYVDQVVRAMKRRVTACYMVLWRLRALAREAAGGSGVGLYLPNMAPVLPVSAPLLQLQSPEVRKLYFVQQFEAYTQYGDFVSRRASRLEARLHARRGHTRLLEFIRKVDDPKDTWSVRATFRVASEQFEPLTLSKTLGGKPSQNWLLEMNSEAGRTDVMRFHDLPIHRVGAPQFRDTRLTDEENRNRRNYLQGKHVAFASVAGTVETVDARGNIVEEVTLALKHPHQRVNPPELAERNCTSALTLEEGASYVLSPRYLNYTSSPVEERLADDSKRDAAAIAANQPSPLFLDLLRDPIRWGTRDPSQPPLWGGPPDAALLPELVALLEEPGPMTCSQQSIYRRLYLEARLQLVWGPPGAGKTYCLASLICRFALRARYEGRTMRILVTAVTHEAINNLLLKVKQLMARVQHARFRTEPLKFAVLDGIPSIGSLVNETRRDGGLPLRSGLRVVRLRQTEKEIEVVDDRAGSSAAVITLAISDVELALDLTHVNPYAKEASAALLETVVIVGCTTQQMPKLEAALIKAARGASGRRW